MFRRNDLHRIHQLSDEGFIPFLDLCRCALHDRGSFFDPSNCLRITFSLFFYGLPFFLQNSGLVHNFLELDCIDGWIFCMSGFCHQSPCQVIQLIQPTFYI